jgi:hypothetical protein
MASSSLQFSDPSLFPFSSVSSLPVLDPLQFDGVDENGKQVEKKIPFSQLYEREDGVKTIVIFGRNLL